MGPRRQSQDAQGAESSPKSPSESGNDSDGGPRPPGAKRKLDKDTQAKRTQEKRQIQLVELEDKIVAIDAANGELCGSVAEIRHSNAKLQAGIDEINAQCRLLKEQNEEMKKAVQMLRGRGGQD
mmetsp:Transcript_23239/g.41282  ORF Transcript_23239/g.41282 Transcript_23239/m.41282 type:complete len:124 (-) Transcript_23239:132-503(-)